MDDRLQERMTPTLFERARRGDTDAFTDLVRTYHTAVRVYLGGYLRDPGVVDDLTQDVFLRAFDRLSKLRDPEAFRAWLMGIARNRALEHLRERLRRGVSTNDLELLLDKEQFAALEGEDEEARLASQLDALRQCIEKLPPTGARLIREHYFKGRAITELAAEAQKNEGALRMMFLRLREVLRKCVRQRAEISGRG